MLSKISLKVLLCSGIFVSAYAMEIQEESNVGCQQPGKRSIRISVQAQSSVHSYIKDSKIINNATKEVIGSPDIEKEYRGRIPVNDRYCIGESLEELELSIKLEDFTVPCLWKSGSRIPLTSGGRPVEGIRLAVSASNLAPGENPVNCEVWVSSSRVIVEGIAGANLASPGTFANDELLLKKIIKEAGEQVWTPHEPTSSFLIDKQIYIIGQYIETVEEKYGAPGQDQVDKVNQQLFQFFLNHNVVRSDQEEQYKKLIRDEIDILQKG